MKNKKNGVLLPDISNEKNKKKNKAINKNHNINLLSIFRNAGYKKKLKIPNLNKKEPAINSSPNGPESLLPLIASKPKIS